MAESAPLPGARPHPAALRGELEAALEALGPGYEPRTEHLLPDGRPRYLNRLILEDSPYLRQHAHNPVDWYPWGPEAFAAAAREDRPIFLSIGYSTCHWCHVMERESFDDPEIARRMNELFIAIKVDREQRPDVDELYMTAVQMLTGRGGWPMSSFLTPSAKPFFGGTYFPPQHFATLLGRVSEAWGTRRADLLETAERLSAAVATNLAARGEAVELGEEAAARAAAQLLSRHDPALGGFGGAPKFPHEPELLFLLDRSLRRGDREALAAATRSLDAMARGGIYDQVGGGFHRYSTDERWLVPHFEKMLYNQAHLARAYLAAYRLTGEPSFERVARQTLDYVLREMTSPEGGFYSATDADSEGEEGLFFVWTPGELREALHAEDAALAEDLFGATEAGNFEGRNVLHLPLGLEDYAQSKNLDLPTLLARVERIRETLRAVREKREPPLRDDKLLTSWNAMMVTALAEGSEILGEPRYLEAAARAAEFLWAESRRKDGGLWRVHLDGRSSVEAVQEDSAYLAEALVALYDATGEGRWLERAAAVADAMRERFWDADAGGFFQSAEGADPLLLVRPKSPGDGAIPSGNSVAVRALARLAARTGEPRFREAAEATATAFSASISRQPSAYSYLLLGLAELTEGGAGPRRYAAAGAVAVNARLRAAEGEGAPLALTVELRLRDGWHVNAHEPLQENLVPTALGLAETTGWSLGDVRYPKPETLRLGFQDEPLAVYQGTIRIEARVTPLPQAAGGGPRVLTLSLRLQACDDEKCLRPEDVALRVPQTGS